MKITIFFGFILIQMLISGASSDISEENCNVHKNDKLRLKCDITKDYNPAEPPVKSHSDALNIYLSMFPLEIDFNDHNDQLSLTAWMMLNWTDVFLHWNPDDYGSVNDLVIDCSDIWTPDLVSLRALADDPYQSASHTVCKVNSTGSVSTVFTTTYKTYCSGDRTYWPYDEFSCTLHLGSRLYIGSTMNFTLKEIMSENLKKDKVWNVKDRAPSIHRFKTGAWANDTYTRLDFTFFLKRHSSVFSATFVFPGAGIVVTILAVLWLDVMSQERLYMLALIVFDEIMFLECFTFLLPASGTNPPLLVNFFRDSITMCGICIVVTIMNRQLINSSLKPAWLTTLIRWLNEKSYITKYLLINMEAENVESQESEDDSPSAFSLASQKRNEWRIFVTCIDRLMFIIYFMIYFLLFIKFYPAI